MSVQEIQVTVNFEFIDDNFDDCRFIVLPGGTRSGKTIAVIQWIIYYCLINTGKEIVICRDTLTNLKRTTLKDFQALCYGLDEYGAMAPNMTLNKADLIANINGNTITFIGLLDDPMRVYGLKSDIFYINEAIATYKHTFLQLNQRCEEGGILDCNPSAPNSWVYKLEQRPDAKFFRTTYLDNPFLNEEIVKEIEAYEPTPENIENGTADERMWSIYGKGLVFKGKEIIYPDWDTYTDDPKNYDHVFYGLDFGINHPLACVKVFVNGNDLYIREIIYKRGIKDLSADVSPILLAEPEIQRGETYVICDSAELKSIHTLTQDNVPAFGVKKPAGSVLTGIRKVGRFNLHVHEDSHNIQAEFNNYKWKVDKTTDTLLDVPVKEWDDACFVGETMITTINGDKPIKDIVTGDKVLTSRGWKNVLNRWDNGVKKTNQYSMQFDMHSLSLQCTENHKVKTDKGWIEISKLESGMTVYLTKCLTAKSTNCTKDVDTSQVMTNVCTGTYGNNPTEQDEKGIIYTTKTRTRTTIGSIILKRLKRSSTYQTMQKRKLKTTQNGLRIFKSKVLSLQRSGTDHQKGLNGTDSTPKTIIGDHLTYQKSNAINAVSSLSQKHITIDSVETIVNHNTDELVELITNKDNAQCVVQNSPSTSIVKQRLVHVSVEECSDGKVYDLHVEDVHEYFANGLLVHNCDALRYVVYTYL